MTNFGDNFSRVTDIKDLSLIINLHCGWRRSKDREFKPDKNIDFLISKITRICHQHVCEFDIVDSLFSTKY